MRYFLLIIFLLTLIPAYAAFDYWRVGPLKEDVTVIIPKGSGFRGSIEALSDANVVRHPLFFTGINVATLQGRNFKAGEYRFPAGITPRDVVDMLVEGKVVIHKVTVTEGMSARDVLALLAAEPVLSGDAPLAVEEGSLLPETYYFSYGDSRASVVKRMQDAMQETLADLWKTRAEGLPISSLREALILASIVEKETGVAEERPRVAAVFVNRLQRAMRLQSDPTVVYGIEQATGAKMSRALTLGDLQTPNPYNTYTIDSLPPGPIANPGRAAIAATLNPLVSNELYFVATGNGGHYFASTLEEHNRNVQLYRAELKKPAGQP